MPRESEPSPRGGIHRRRFAGRVLNLWYLFTLFVGRHRARVGDDGEEEEEDGSGMEENGE